MWHLLYGFFGLSGTGSTYAFWSGVGSDLGEVALVGGVYAGFRKVNCHEHRCWRIGRHPVDGTPFVVCRKHHPDIDHTQPLHVADHPLTLAASSGQPASDEAGDG